jgi:hypothetical protein
MMAGVGWHTACPVGAYRYDLRSDSCILCPPTFTTLTDGAYVQDACVCMEGYTPHPEDRWQPCLRKEKCTTTVAWMVLR